MHKQLNTRTLIIDDDEHIRESFREILRPEKVDHSALEDAAELLFQEKETRKTNQASTFDFLLDEACNGQEGLDCVREAVEEGHPYAVIFVDMRMPGWDGLQTVQHIRMVDTRAEVIFVTAYSDHSIDEIVREAGTNVGYHCKPFEVDEIRQIATKSVYEWNKTRNLESLISSISTLKTSQWNADLLLGNILQQLSEMLGSQSAMLLMHEGAHYRKILGIGDLASDQIANPLIKSLPQSLSKENPVHEGYAFFKLNTYDVVVLFDKAQDQLRQEHLYLVRLFLEHAGQTLENVNLHETIVQQRSLSAIGQAVSMISHDLRNSVAGIISCSDILASELPSGQPSEFLGMIRSSAKEALTMVEDVLDFVRGAGPKLTENESVAFMDRLAAKIRPLEERFPDVTFAITPPSPFTFTCDTTKLIRVVENLVLNAAEALHEKKSAEGHVLVRMFSSDDETRILVEDNGPGIPADHQQDIFTPFKTFGKNNGTGLGLAIAKQFVESHNGSLSFTSVPGKTVFEIIL